MAKFFITGGTGFIGSALVRSLIKKGESVVIFKRDKTSFWRLKDISKECEIITGDLRDKSLKSKIKKIKPTYIFHLATYGAVPEEDDTDNLIDVNIKGTINLFEAAKGVDVKLFVNTGSSSEYGVSKRAIKESDPTFPINDYGISKLAATLYSKKEAERYLLPSITFRLFSPYGYFESSKRLIPSVVINALQNKTISVGSPNNVRDFIFIEDVVNAYLLATKAQHLPGSVYNIGSGQQHNVSDVVKCILHKSKSQSNVNWGAVKNQKRQIEPKKWQANITKAGKNFYWKPTYSFEEGIVKTIDWFYRNKSLYEEN